jgi:hypothetical protein
MELDGDISRDLAGRVEGETTLSVKAQRVGASDPEPVLGLGSLSVDAFLVRYESTDQDSKVVVRRVDSGPADLIHLRGDGSYRGEPLHLSMTLPNGRAVTDAGADAPMPVSLDASFPIGNSTLAIDGQVSPTRPLESLRLDLSAASEAPSAVARFSVPMSL